MASGPVVAYVLAKRDGVAEWRRLIGPADVSVAKTDFPSSLRAIYGTRSAAGPVANAFHGSHCPAAARLEIRFFFPDSEWWRRRGGRRRLESRRFRIFFNATRRRDQSLLIVVVFHRRNAGRSLADKNGRTVAPHEYKYFVNP